jgi:hypothetical protein
VTGDAAEHLTAISIVLDGRLGHQALAGVAALAARLGFDVWWREPPLAGAAAGAAASAGTRAGTRASGGSGGSAGLTALLGALANAAGQGHVGLILDLDSLKAGPGTDLTGVLAVGPRMALIGQPGRVADELGRLPALSRSRAAVEYRRGQPTAGGAPSIAGSAPSLAVFIPVSAGRNLDAQVAGAVAVSGGGRVLAELPVSIGRTAAEAYARAGAETLFEITGRPAEQGLFGTLEQCQYRAAELAYAGVTELVCHLPNSRDVADVLAQLRAVAAVGRDVLRPGEPPSPAPPPPAGWGGRRLRSPAPPVAGAGECGRP